MSDVQIQVYNLIGSEYCTDIEDGQELYNYIYRVLSISKSIEVSFKNIEIITPSFLEVSIGQLYKYFTEDDIKSLMNISDISDTDKLLISRAIDTTKEFYKNPEILNSSI